MIPVIIPVTQSRSRTQEIGNCILESPILQISRGGGGMPPDPPRSSCLAPAARTVHVRQLNHCIRYFQMLPKALIDRNKKAYHCS